MAEVRLTARSSRPNARTASELTLASGRTDRTSSSRKATIADSGTATTASDAPSCVEHFEDHTVLTAGWMRNAVDQHGHVSAREPVFVEVADEGHAL